MSLIKSEVIKVFRSSEQLFFCVSKATNRPFLICDPESCYDQVWVFPTEEDAKPFVEEYRDRKFELTLIKLEKKNLPNFIFQLRALGATAIVWKAGSEAMEIEIDEIFPKPKLTPEQQKKVPPTNPSLQTCGIYFMQEMRRPLTMDEHELNGCKDIEEELLVNIRRSTLFMLFKSDPKDPKKIGPLMIKGQDGKMYQLFFSDMMETNGFVGKDSGIRVAPVQFRKLKEMLPPQVEGIILNPGGFNMTMKRDQVVRLIDEGVFV